MSQLDALFEKSKQLITDAKADGHLSAGELARIAVELARVAQKIGGLHGPEKSALVLHALKKGLDAAGGIPQLAGIPAETAAIVEKQLLDAASAALDLAVAAARGGLSDLQKKKACLDLLCRGAAVAAQFLPKDVPAVREALEFAQALRPAESAPKTPANPESETRAPEPVVADTPPETQPQKVSSPPEEAPGAPAPALEVKFE
jgi:hypothetical protein